MTVLAMEGVGFSRDGRPILQDASFAVGAGEMVALLGPNGAGKTTVLRLLLRLLYPGTGKVLLDGRSLARMRRRELASRVAYVPQGHAVTFPYKVRDVVALGRLAATMFSPVVSAADRAAADAAMGHLAIGHLAERSYAALSGGERQGVLIARALAQGARILVLDEPETGLDYGQQRRLFDLLRHLAAEGYAVIATTHDPLRAARTFTRAILLRRGRIMNDGPAGQVLSEQTIEALYDAGA
ncbi:ABC transporter ATP-binding protein [Gluconacetobacter azotocaptans]|uniref:ABC transporter ATP-binding protein n=1 Tax=Gluconacetobacter azotocaptans TaxID=142834 RepID=A0A7W4JRI8_9PROT|nr:ABC transporter ATP-binding protein [Gluconacetobacter azotocaptans]MBB2189543.1 ABC transporter ATP-binding protein [Gluconacetobacter azotocaptans]MBM9403152.1 ABC transporter ATP-binding protein [Gluconacetobacter azotocaptans]GBQ36622.1 ferrichrome ABC transporter ATP-binding protein [Gluconacetobacter azotocaptans DSM 13594]